MSSDPDQASDENAAEEIFKPIDDLLAREAEDLKDADEEIGRAEAKMKKVVREAKRDDEE